MKIHTVEVVYSYPLNRLFLRGFKHRDIGRLKSLCKDFEEIFSKRISPDLVHIRIFSGLDWNKTYIRVYIVGDCPHSISDPLILRYQDNPAFMYMLLLHELVHNNLEGNVRILKHSQLEVYVNAVVKAVLEKSCDGRVLLGTAFQEKNWKSMLKSGISLTEKRPLKAVLETEVYKREDRHGRN